MKTLYVQPLCLVGGNYSYWESFVKLFNDLYHKENPGTPEVPEEKYWARIKPFENAGVRVVVIGAPNCPYHPEDSHVMRIECKGLIGKCPATDTPCRGMGNSYLPGGQEYNYGHTYFRYGGWCCGTLGYTPGRGQGPVCYGTPSIFPYALENLFTEGAYPSLATNQTPIAIRKPEDGPCTPETQRCYDELKHCPNLRQCYEFNHFSPMAENELVSVCRPPDGTVQVGKYTFRQDNAAINHILDVSKWYDQRQVLAHVIVHEMGHALLNTQENLVPADHECDNRGCIMYRHFEDFALRDFGPDCKHGPHGSMAISNCVLD
jgi:hypothetical protein